MAFQLLVFNPSNYPRKGHVVFPWQPIEQDTGIKASELVLEDEHGRLLPHQVDRLDPSDPSRDVLVFSLASELCPGPEDYSSPSASLRLERGSRRLEEREAGSDVTSKPGRLPTHVELCNENLTVSFCLSPSQPDSRGNWYAGSADSVRLGGKEMLDRFQAELTWMGHDPDKRCMQIDRLLLGNPAWQDLPYQEIHLSSQGYKALCQCAGPVRESVAIVSDPFHYDYFNILTGRWQPLVCKVHRIISVFVNGDYVLEEVSVKATPGEASTATEGIAEAKDLRFTPRYFANMHIGYDPVTYRFELVPDWFAVGYPHGYVSPGYGFATDVHVSRVSHPHPDYPDSTKAFRTFSWELSPCKRANCLHLFMQGPVGFDARTGHAWYEHIYKPLKASLKELE